jgi:hypothetical protein
MPGERKRTRQPRRDAIAALVTVGGGFACCSGAPDRSGLEFDQVRPCLGSASADSGTGVDGEQPNNFISVGASHLLNSCNNSAINLIVLAKVSEGSSAWNQQAQRQPSIPLECKGAFVPLEGDIGTHLVS